MKTVFATFNGEDSNIGRFGWVPRGTILPLSPAEARDVARDKRFKVLEVKPGSPCPFPLKVDESDPQKAALADKLNREFELNEAPEEARRGH
jgi:hypothetical protein